MNKKPNINNDEKKKKVKVVEDFFFFLMQYFLVQYIFVFDGDRTKQKEKKNWRKK